MKISSLDIRKQEFSRSFRGYDPDEVDAFLQMVSDQWQELVDELQRAKDRIHEQELKLDHYMKVEEALEEALQTARSSARQTIENAENRARTLLEDAERKAVRIQTNAEEERLRLKKDTARFEVRRKEIVSKLRAFLMSEMEMLAHFEGDDPTGFIKLLPSDDQRSLANAYLEDATERGAGRGSEDREDQSEDREGQEEPTDAEARYDDEPESSDDSNEVETVLEYEDEEVISSDVGDQEEEPEEDEDEPEYDVHRIYQEDSEEEIQEPEPETNRDKYRNDDGGRDESDDTHLRARLHSDADSDATDEIKKIRKILEDLDN